MANTSMGFLGNPRLFSLSSLGTLAGLVVMCVCVCLCVFGGGVGGGGLGGALIQWLTMDVNGQRIRLKAVKSQANPRTY